MRGLRAASSALKSSVYGMSDPCGLSVSATLIPLEHGGTDLEQFYNIQA